MIGALRTKARHWLARLAANRRRRARGSLPAMSELRTVTLLKLDRIGDFILSTGALAALREALPAARFTLIVRKPCGEIARQQYPDWRIIELPARENAFRNTFAHHRVRSELRRLPECDLLVDLRAFRDYSDTVLASWISARCKLALQNAFPDSFACYCYPGEDTIYDELVAPNDATTGECNDLTGLRTLVSRVIGRPAVTRPILAISASAVCAVKEQLAQKFGFEPSAPYVVVYPGTSSPIKEIPAPRLGASLLAGLKSVPEIPIVIAGSVADIRTTAPLVADLQDKRAIHDATGLFTLAENIALIAGARALVGMDSCHIHMAGALGIPAVGILGGGQFGDFAPWGESARFRWVHHRTECYGCKWICPFPQAHCLHDIPPDEIAAAIREVLSASAE
jgi:ADP-heptose:LPS heptosyltransferase